MEQVTELILYLLSLATDTCRAFQITTSSKRNKRILCSVANEEQPLPPAHCCRTSSRQHHPPTLRAMSKVRQTTFHNNMTAFSHVFLATTTTMTHDAERLSQKHKKKEMPVAAKVK